MHSEGILAGEMKHGPLALVDDRMPILGEKRCVCGWVGEGVLSVRRNSCAQVDCGLGAFEAVLWHTGLPACQQDASVLGAAVRECPLSLSSGLLLPASLAARARALPPHASLPPRAPYLVSLLASLQWSPLRTPCTPRC